MLGLDLTGNRKLRSAQWEVCLHFSASFAFRQLCWLQHVEWTKREFLKFLIVIFAYHFPFKEHKRFFSLCKSPKSIASSTILQVQMTLAWWDRWSPWAQEVVKWFNQGPRAWERPPLELSYSCIKRQVSSYSICGFPLCWSVFLMKAMTKNSISQALSNKWLLEGLRHWATQFWKERVASFCSHAGSY